MSRLYTYDDFKREAEKNGLYGNFSDADLKLAEKNPDAGMSILKYKKDYTTAQTDEAKALANAGAERIRSDYGSYIGGGDGGSFAITPMSPDDFSGGSAPTYSSKYKGQIDGLVNDTLNRTYQDYLQGDDYAALKNKYTESGNRAMTDTVGQVSARTGGIGSSYAAAAGQQSYNQYMGQLGDAARAGYASERNQTRENLNALMGLESMERSQFDSDRAQFNNDRSFSYGNYADELSHRQDARDFDYSKASADRQFQYQTGRDSVSDQRYDSERNNAKAQADWEQKYNAASLAAQYGDFSGFKALGYTDAQIKEMRRQWQIQQWR